MEVELEISLAIKELSLFQYPSAPGPNMLRHVNSTSAAVWWCWSGFSCKIRDLLGNNNNNKKTESLCYLPKTAAFVHLFRMPSTYLIWEI